MGLVICPSDVHMPMADQLDEIAKAPRHVLRTHERTCIAKPLSLSQFMTGDYGNAFSLVTGEFTKADQ
jgi:hypothetical protein